MYWFKSFLISIVLSSGLLAPCVALCVDTTDKSKPLRAERPSHYYVEVDLPRIVQKDIIEKAVRMAKKVYPGVNADMLRLDFEKDLSEAMRSVRVSEAMGPSMGLHKGIQKVGAGCSLTSWEYEGVSASELPVGVKLLERTNPVDMEEAKKIADGVLSCLIPNAKERKNFEMVDSIKSPWRDIYGFWWKYKWSDSLEGSGRSVRVTIREKDGLVLNASISAPLEEPAIPFEVILEEAREKVYGVRRKDMRLAEIHHFADRRLVWEHADDKGTYIKDHCIWDAMTGELLYSVVLNGGTYHRPYRNPTFYSYPTEEEVKAMVEKLIEKQVEELEEK